MTIALLLGAISMAAQDTRKPSHGFHYYPLKELKDTITYLKRNFDEQRSYFKGKTFDEFWQIIRQELTPKVCSQRTTSPHIDPKGISYIFGAFVGCMDISKVSADTAETLSAHIRMSFKPPYTVGDDLFYRLPNNITIDGYAKLLSNFIIDDIWVFTVDRREIYL